MKNYDYTKIHRQCGWNEEEIKKSNICGCFFCLKIYPANEIVEWIDEPVDCPRGAGKTAVCPNCGIDAVLPESNDYDITQDFINDMGKEYFGS